MRNSQYLFAFVIGFFLNCCAASTTENEETLRQSALSALHENKLTFTDNKGMNYTLQPTVPKDNFRNTITEGWHLSLIYSTSSASSFHTTSTRTVNSGAPTVSKSSSNPQTSEGRVYTIYDKNNSPIGTLLEGSHVLRDFPEEYKQGLLSGAHGLEEGAAHATTLKQKEGMLRGAQAMKKAAETLK